MKCSLYDLSFDYMRLNCSHDIPKEDKIAATKALARLLGIGFTAEEISRRLKMNIQRANAMDAPDHKAEIDAVFAGKKPETVYNLLKPGTLYFHNELRLTPAAPVSTVNYDTGEITKQIEPYFLEMRASYTVNDLYDYFVTKTRLYDKMCLYKKKFIGGLEWLITRYDLDMLLYMIDIAEDDVACNDRRPLTSPIGVEEYASTAKAALEHKLTDSRMNGGDRVVPRKRLLFG